MLLTYHTTNEVNLATLRELAVPHGLVFEHHEPRDGLAAGPVVLIDADFWWFSHAERNRGLRKLIQEERHSVLAVHGWGLLDEQLALLRDNGIHAFNKLDATLVAVLADELAALPARATNQVQTL